MRRIVITDVGPITKTATIEYNRFCILIGPQSNGKSTIAKLLSTCLWIEKEACTSLTTDIVKDGESFVRLVEDFHRMHNYIHPDRSYIEYQSSYVTVIYDKGKFQITFKDNLSYNRLKISYVPSDRNVVTMKDIEKRDLEPTNFRSFLFDWLDTNRNFNVKHKA
jgi:ABC-type cobalamin/Fe3+-siderophores transport system ATPase subunit